jgi:hypothetical protein
MKRPPYERGVLLFKKGETDRAAEVFRHYPNHPQALTFLGAIANQRKDFHSAGHFLNRALKIDPSNHTAHFFLGTALNGMDRTAEARVAFEWTLAIKPDHAFALIQLGRHAEALPILEAMDARDPAVRTATAIAWQGINRSDKALELLANPGDDPAANWARAISLLQLGRFDEGWTAFEWRYQHLNIGTKAADDADRLWRGQFDIAGKRVLLYREQGFGDAIQFARFAPILADRGATVLIERTPGLDILGTLRGVTMVETPQPSDIDCHCPFPGLPNALRIGAAVGMDRPYLSADPERVANWARRLGARMRPRVGLAWSGNPRHQNDTNRSMTREMFNILDTFADVYPVQPTDDWPLDGFDDTAALMMNLDMIVSVDSAPAHLAGALGLPLIIMLPWAPDWRWQLDRDDTPWYPTAVLLRQERPGDWNGVVARILATVQRL